MTTEAIHFPRGAYIVLHIRRGPPYPDQQNYPHIAEGGRFQLTEDMWIERLENDLATNVQRACEPANYQIHNSVHDRHVYAFIREVPANQPPREPGMVSRDEALIPLMTAISLSRLIRPTTTGDRYCANILPYFRLDGPIRAVQLSGVCPDVYLGDLSRDWLGPEDGPQLLKLMPWLSPQKLMHERIHRAFWNHEQAVRTYYLDTRWTIAVSALEALINVDGRHVRQQFIRRVGNLAGEFGISLSPDELHDAYTLRSKLAHGQNFLYGLHDVLPPDQHRPLYDKLETLLRTVLKTCLLDETFGEHFASGAGVKKKWD